MSGTTLRLVERRAQVGPPRPDVDVVVLDPWWTPGPGERPEVRPVRPIVERILEEVDLVDGSLQRLDAWAAAAGLADRFVVEGAAWWHRIRMAIRWDLHEMMIWQRVLVEIAPANRYSTIEVPWRRTALVAATRAWVASEPMRGPGGQPGTRVVTRHTREEPPDIYRRFRRWAGRWWRIRWAVGVVRGLDPSVARRRAQLGARIRRLAADPPRVLAIAWAGAFHIVRGDDGDRRMDPHLTLVLDRMAAGHAGVAMVVEGLDHQVAADWRVIAGDEGIIPQSIVDQRGWASGEAVRLPARPRRAGRPDPVRLDVDGVDLGPAMDRLVDGYVGLWQEAMERAARWAERFLAAVRPQAIYLDREGTRTKWIVAARRRGIPVVAIQHGMIYPGNPEYVLPPGTTPLRADFTCVFGPAERDVLTGEGGYRTDEVVVTGSPRSGGEMIRQASDREEQANVRRELGVADGNRLLVVSVAHNPVGDLYSAAMVARLLDGPLPWIHVVVKIHPQDRSDPDYAGLLNRLAKAGAYQPPAVSVIRDIDLYRLLRSADAHLGQYSTVLTDAVVAGIPNMIALGQAHIDPLDYVSAGVAVPVRSVDEVRTFMADPRPPLDTARAAFLERHFASGDAVGRIAGVLLEAGRARAEAAP
ncbi:MAG: hypothetical protein ACHQ15_05385 [Candidatus Limnocylindrales bacterium]